MIKSGEAKLDKYYCCVAGNTEFFELMGAKLGNSLGNRVHPEDKERFEKLFENSSSEKSVDVLRVLDYKDEYKWVILNVWKEGSKSPTVVYRIEILSISELSEERAHYAPQINDFRIMLASQHGKYFCYTPKDNIFKMYFILNDSEVYFYNDDVEKVKEEMLNAHTLKEDRNVVEEFFDVITKGERPISDEFETTILTRGVQKEICLFSGEPVYGYNGEFEKYIGVIKSFDTSTREDITYYKLERNRDVLTGLLNKSVLSGYVTRLMKNSDKPITFGIMDIDDFKDVNDYGGHSFGDKVLVAFSQIIKNAVGKRGIVGRFGGDEFFIVLDGIGEAQGIRSVLRSIKMNFQEAYAHIDEIKISCSIGAAIYPKSAKDYDELFKMADFALYRAKQNGKNRFVVYDEKLHGEILTADENVVQVGSNSKRIDYISVFCNSAEKLLDKNKDGIPEALSTLGINMGMGRINLIYGNKFTEFFTWGEPNNAKMPFDFLTEEKFKDFFDTNNLLVVDTKSQFESKLPLFDKYIWDNGILFCIVVMIGNKEDIKGYMTFEFLSDRRKLKNSEIMTIAAVSKIISNVILKEIKNCIRFSN